CFSFTHIRTAQDETRYRGGPATRRGSIGGHGRARRVTILIMFGIGFFHNRAPLAIQRIVQRTCKHCFSTAGALPVHPIHEACGETRRRTPIPLSHYEKHTLNPCKSCSKTADSSVAADR